MTTDLPSPARPLRIGTRGSPLALAQAHETRGRLMAAFDLPEEAFEIVVIKTTGDDRSLIDADVALKTLGGKGLFTKEIEEDMLSGKIDIAVHSMKDMPVAQPEGLLLDCYLPREDVRDAFVSLAHGSLADLPTGAKVGSSSLRRRAQLKVRRPDLEVVEFRGNVQTRMKKLGDGVADATFLAMAGLKRLGMTEVVKSAIAPEDVLPAVAQGAIGIERRAADMRAAAMLEAIHDGPTGSAARGGACFSRRSRRVLRNTHRGSGRAGRRHAAPAWRDPAPRRVRGSDRRPDGPDRGWRRAGMGDGEGPARQGRRGLLRLDRRLRRAPR
jgi:hydroxymethylbilane synthase